MARAKRFSTSYLRNRPKQIRQSTLENALCPQHFGHGVFSAKLLGRLFSVFGGLQKGTITLTWQIVSERPQGFPIVYLLHAWLMRSGIRKRFQNQKQKFSPFTTIQVTDSLLLYSITYLISTCSYSRNDSGKKSVN